MTATIARPFNQKIRILALRLAFLGLLPLTLFTRPAISGGAADLLETAGILAILLAVLGRFWAILYIGGRKNRTLLREGPYSICRHPLYLFSTIGATGFGLMLESVTLAAVMGGAAFVILSLTASREERFLRAAFAGYADYAREVPRMLPALRLFHTPACLTVDTGTLAGNAADALVFVTLIPLAELLR
ncbi:methyltransferase family protein [Pseudoroseicyclus aestuarii]|uniref:Protein-S-isoprenylcysteine O-methyltransferase Ste14 n=1 Tax=Pseudoroseicyclus aestuarii TaxID=1795041 RepID=A0A318SQ41_9RHOB|nr:isoprenylcysteine carboxylmethyltransferase family protein [Pseudoroseicyclus aestuarii]PYE82468.1 protein-S-isoprenylcysteine O-methyltransferase Ste14 [Pseudoroseicyclus aestuarii]